MLVPDIAFVNPPLNQRVIGMYGYPVSVMNACLWDKPLIPRKIRQKPPMRRG